MKKTVIAAALAMTMLPVASAATSGYPETLESLTNFSDLTGHRLDVYDGSFSLDTSEMGLTATDGFSLSFYMQYNPIKYKLDGEQFEGHDYWKDALTLTFGSEAIRLEMHSSNKLAIYGSTNLGNGEIITKTNVTSKWVHIGMSFEGNQLKTYVDGKLSETTTLTSADYELTAIADGSTSNNPGKSGQILLDDIAVFSSALDETAYAAMPARSIPEPATATLSLLALAGLAARRRRK